MRINRVLLCVHVEFFFYVLTTAKKHNCPFFTVQDKQLYIYIYIFFFFWVEKPILNLSYKLFFLFLFFFSFLFKMTIKLIYKVLLCKVYCGCVFWLVHSTVHGPAKCKLQVNCKFEQQKIFCYIIFSNKFSVFSKTISI